MNSLFHSLFFALCCSSFVLTTASDDSADFIDERGKALKHLKVVPGSKRTNIDFQTVEQEAGRAVLKLLDAKIGKKVNDAAKEVTDFLNDAVGHHAEQRTKHIQSDKEKEMSLLHLGAKKVLTNNDEEDKPKKNKDGSYLVHFKIPYIVTPVVKKKPKPKKYHHKHVKKPHHLKKYHHRVLHHKHHHHNHHAHALDANKPMGVPQATYNPQAPATQPPTPPPNYNAIDLTFNGYNWTYQYTNDSSSDMVPCQGSCMDPCTQACSLSQDCCCCDPNMMSQMQNQMVSATDYPPVAPSAPPMYQPPAPTPAFSPSSCPFYCKRNCFTYCPRQCCGFAGKRDKVLSNEGSGNNETVDQGETDQKDKGSASEVVEQSEEEKSGAKDSEGDNDKSKEQTSNNDAEEGSSSGSDVNNSD